MNPKLPYYMAYPMPLAYDDERIERRDYEYMRSLYPVMAKRVLPYVEEECDRMEYQCSMMYDEYPDKLQLRMMCDRIYDNVRKHEKIIFEDEYAEFDIDDEIEEQQIRFPGRPPQPGPGRPPQPGPGRPPQPGPGRPPQPGPGRLPQPGPGRPPQPGPGRPPQPGPGRPPQPGPGRPPQPGPGRPPQPGPGRPPQPGPGRPPQGNQNWLRDLIQVLLYQELLRRRCDNRRCDRRFY